TSIRTDTSSSTTSIEYKHVVKNEQDFDQQQNYNASSGNLIDNYQFSSFSFKFRIFIY
ncbi:unnamed protein product, partial [Rotaria sp. Silwood2]